MKPILESGQFPSICAPITGRDELVVFEQLKTIISQAPDVIEWRADYFEDIADSTTVLEVMRGMKRQTDIPVLFTIRGAHEGGNPISLSEQEIVFLLLALCEHSSVDMIDYEASNKPEFIHRVREVSQVYGKMLVLSYHNFSLTPTETELIKKAKLAAEYGADVVKLAVMPEDKEDVFHFMNVTRKLDLLLKVPIVTMSMGTIGALSRVIGWTYGSAMTFGVGVEVSAPGQVPVMTLRRIIHEMKEVLPVWGIDER